MQAWPVHIRVLARPRWPIRLPAGGGADGLLCQRGAVLERLVHTDREPVRVRAASAPGGVLIGAWGDTRSGALQAIVRMRLALGIDADLGPFHERFRWDPLLGPALRADPGFRPPRRPEPFEALAWAVCEQLIDYPRAAAIQRRLIARLGRSCPRSGLRDAPSADALAAASPAELQACDLAGSRARALVSAAREVASGRVDLRGGAEEAGWRRLRAIPGIGPWTIETLALHGQGRLDQVPAGDLNLLALVGRLHTGDPEAYASEEEVRRQFAPYAPYSGLAAAYAQAAGAAGLGRLGRSPTRRLSAGPTVPGRGGTRWSAPPVPREAA